MKFCPYCNGDLVAYQTAARKKLNGAMIYRGVAISVARLFGGSIIFRLNGRRYEDRRRFLNEEDAVNVAKALIDELLDSAKVESVEE